MIRLPSHKLPPVHIIQFITSHGGKRQEKKRWGGRGTDGRGDNGGGVKGDRGRGKRGGRTGG